MEKPDVRVCRAPDLKRKMLQKHVTAQDRLGNPVGLRDIVNIDEGKLKGRSGTVKYIFRRALFLFSR